MRQRADTLLKRILPAAALVFLFACKATPEPAPELKPEPVIPHVDTLKFIAAGDNLINITMIRDSKTADGYNFSPVYSEVTHLIQAADLAYINQETIFGGAQFGYSGYPQFNTPESMAQTLVETGFDIVNIINNHVMDMGEAGLLAAMNTWDSFPETAYLGVRQTVDKPPVIISKNNISLGFLSYTYGTNGLPLPRNKPWMVSMINRETIAAEIDALRPLCDFLIVSMHWGDEYSAEPSAVQIGLAQFLAEHQVDVIIGHHPHVLQRIEYLPRTDGKQTVCFYSLGNFANNQDRNETALGGLLYIKFVKTESELAPDNAGLIPVVSHFEQGYTKTRIIPLYAYTPELLETHRHYSRNKNFTLDYFKTLLENLNSNIYTDNPLAVRTDNDNP